MDQSLIFKLNSVRKVLAYHRAFHCNSKMRDNSVWRWLANISFLYDCTWPEAEIVKLISDLSEVTGWMWSLLREWDNDRIFYHQTAKSYLAKIELSNRLYERLNDLKTLRDRIKKCEEDEPDLCKDLITHNSFAYYLGVELSRKEIPTFEFPDFDFSDLNQIIESIRAVDLDDRASIQKIIHLVGKDSFNLKHHMADQYINKWLN